MGNHYGDAMRAACADPTVVHLNGAHWLPIERKAELVRAVRTSLEDKAL